MYSWPTTNRCRGVQVTATGGHEAEDFFDTSLTNVHGLVTIGVKPRETLTLSLDTHLFAVASPRVPSVRFHGVELDLNTGW